MSLLFSHWRFTCKFCSLIFDIYLLIWVFVKVRIYLTVMLMLYVVMDLKIKSLKMATPSDDMGSLTSAGTRPLDLVGCLCAGEPKRSKKRQTQRTISPCSQKASRGLWDVHQVQVKQPSFRSADESERGNDPRSRRR